jgi:hypothetical protein
MTEATVSQDVQGPEGSQERAKNKAAFDRRVEEIRNHPDLSQEAKKRYLSEAWEEAQAKDQEIVAEGKRVEEEKIAKLEKEVFAVPAPLAATTGEKMANRQSYRDASFRVLDALDKVAVGDRQRVLSDLMESLLEVACYHTAIERVTGTSPTPTGPSILRPPSCDGHAFGGHRDPGAGAGAALLR